LRVTARATPSSLPLACLRGVALASTSIRLSMVVNSRWRTERRSRMEGDIDRRRLGSYLNDHLAGSVEGIRTARRAAEENVQNEYGALLGRMARELEEEQKVLRQVLRRLEVP